MASFHARSNSFPSQPHPVMESVEDQLNRSKSSDATPTSVCASLASLRDLLEGVNNVIQMPSTQQALSHEQARNSINELLDGSLRLVDLCGLSRDVVGLTKESVQDLKSSIRRNKGEAATAVDIDAYAASRKKINKMCNRCIKNLKCFNQNSMALPGQESDVKAIETVLKETEALGFSVLKSVLIVLSGEKERSSRRSWSLLSKFTQTNRVHSGGNNAEDLCSLNIYKPQKTIDGIALQNMLEQLQASEMTIQELEDGLEALFKSLVKTRVSLLNVLSH